MDFALFDFALMAEVIKGAKNQNARRNQVKYNLVINASFHLKEIFDTQACH